MARNFAPELDMFTPHLIAPGFDEDRVHVIYEGITNRYNGEPWRHHHVVNHLIDGGGFLLENVSKLERPRPTLCAWLYHDGIYLPEAPPGSNEERSAQLAQSELRPYLVPSAIRRIGQFIRATASHKWDGIDTDLAHMLDADMKPLGAPEEEFDEYDENVKKEFVPFYGLEAYLFGRERFLTSVIGMDRIFNTDEAYERWEKPAKANAKRKFDELKAA